MNPARQSSHGQQREPLLEPLLASLRYRHSLACLRQMALQRPIIGLDYGCGYQGRFVSLANRIPGVSFHGCDLSVSAQNPALFCSSDGKLDATRLQPDVITLHAVLEHLDDPRGTVEQLRRLLPESGLLLLTVPSKRSQPLLEFLAFRLGLISKTEIADHKQYYDRDSLQALLGDLFPVVRHEYFQLGMNNRVLAQVSATHAGPC